MKKVTKSNAMLERFHALDGMRGLATFSVFLSHAFGLFNQGSIIYKLESTPIQIIWDSAAAVDMFFFLSGFVLTIGFFNSSTRTFNAKSFLIRRIFRLYPPYAISIFVAIILRYTLFQSDGLNGLGSWIAAKWVYDVEWTHILRHLFIINSNSNINSTMWAMIIIIRVALLFPIIIFLLKRFNLKSEIITFICCTYLLAIWGHFSATLYKNWHMVNNLMQTMIYLPVFVGGAIFAKYRIKIISLFNCLVISPQLKIMFLVLGLLLYNIRYSFPITLLDGYIYRADHNIFVDSISGVGCLIIILSVLTSNHLSRILSFNILTYFGKISYSFYLLHFPILLVLSSIVIPYNNSKILTMLLSFFVTIFSSHLFYSLIEIPFQKSGRKLSELIENKSNNE